MNYTITPLKMQEPFPGFLSGGCKIAGPEFGQFAEKKGLRPREDLSAAFYRRRKYLYA